MPESINTQIKRATKWSAISEVAAKLVSPITSMILARLLTPEEFGIVATLNMVIAFAEIFTDAGFQKYLVQHEFKDDIDRDESTNVAFWSNLLLSFVIWGIIIIFNEPIARIVGNPGLGYVLAIACISIPLASFSSIQMALYKRDLDFKTLFKVRIIGVLVPIVVTIPLAFWLRSFWALVIGTICVNLVNALLLTLYSKWKPRFYFQFDKLTGMLSFTVWSMIEAVSIWLTSYVDIFIVGKMLNQHYLGLYKTSSALIGQIMGLITATTTPILFSALSRLQKNESEFNQLFFHFQKVVGLLVIPLGVGIFIFSDLMTKLLLGSQWMEASGFVGIWALTSSFTIVLAHYSSEVYRAKGRPKLSVLAQALHIVVLWPTVIVAVHYGFKTLYVARSLVRLESILVNLIIMRVVLKMNIGKMITNILPSCVAAASMALILFFPHTENYLLSLTYVVISIILYLGVVFVFPEDRSILRNFDKILKTR